jgi:predicted DNA-binding ribbon-helix-helix protein
MRKRSITIGGHGTSIALEDAFWRELEALATARGQSLSALVAEIDRGRTGPGNLASTLRLFVLEELTRNRRD